MNNHQLPITNHQLTSRGFTLLEILVVIMIMGFLTAMVAGHFLGVKEDAGNVTGLNEMKKIKEAIRDRFYPDLGLIPEDAVHPEMAIRFLCLKDDGIGGIERGNMSAFLVAQSKPASLINWDKYSRKGWRGPYMEQKASHDYDGLVGPGIDWWPIVVNPWADFWENKAQREEDAGNNVLADDYRSRKCYYIFGGQNRNLAQVVCYGANGEADCDKVVGTDGNTYVCIEMHTSAAANHPVSGIDWVDFWALDNTQTGNAWAAGMDYESFWGDDLVMFVFGAGATRSP